MKIQEIDCIGTGIYKLATDSAEFYLRAEYLRFVSENELCAGAEFFDERADDLLNAALAFAAEKKAVSYLERSEQCRAGLEKKLLQKNFGKDAIDAALDYLEGRGFLDDARFARAWLNARRIAKPEGRTRLLAELAARGIGHKTAEAAVKEFFAQNDEMELCRRALEKRSREKKSGEKLVAALQRDGFSYKMIQAAIAEKGITNI